MNKESKTKRISRRSLIKGLPLVAGGGVMALLSSCAPGYNKSHLDTHRIHRRASRRNNSRRLQSGGPTFYGRGN